MENLQKCIVSLRRKLKKHSDPERAVQEKRYLKSPFRFFGVSLPLTDKISREFKKSNHNATREYILEVVKRLWNSPFHDEKRLGLRILRLYPEHLDLSVMPLFEDMLEHSPTWDLVDDISIHLVGTVVGKDKKAYSYLKKWSKSDNFWLRRASLVSQILLFRKNRGDNKLFFKIAEKMVPEKEFFIRKAIGWSLREISKTDPEASFKFLMKIKDRASGLTLREGAKRLPEDLKAVLSVEKK